MCDRVRYGSIESGLVWTGSVRRVNVWTGEVGYSVVVSAKSGAVNFASDFLYFCIMWEKLGSPSWDEIVSGILVVVLSCVAFLVILSVVLSQINGIGG